MTMIQSWQSRLNRFPVASLFLAAMILSGEGEVEAQQADRPPADWSLPVSQGTLGVPGLIAIPVAGALPVGFVDVGYSSRPDYNVFSRFGLDRQHNIQVSVGLFSRLVISGRGSEVIASDPQPPYFFQDPSGVIRLIERPFLRRDLSASVSLLLLKEERFLPAIAIGAKDFGGAASLLEARYGVISKTLAGRVRLTAGYGWGEDLLKGAFGGVEVVPIRQVTLLGEYDTERFNGGIRLKPVPEGLVSRGVPQATVDVTWAEDEGVTWSVSLRAVLDQDWIQRPRSLEETGRSTNPTTSTAGVDAVEVVARLLVDDGFENVEISEREGALLRVEYENRRYNQHELDGLTRVLRTVAVHAPDEVEDLRIILKQMNRKAMQIDLRMDDLRQFIRGGVTPEVFRDRFTVGYPGDPRPSTGVVSRSSNSSFFKADVTLYPGLNTFVFSEVSVAQARLSLAPNLRIGLFTGTAFEAQYWIPIGQTERYGLLGGALPDGELSIALLHHAQSWSLSNRTAFVAQWSVGRFTPRDVGVRQEASVSLLGGLVRLGVDVAALGDDENSLDRRYAVGSARLLIPRFDTRVTVRAGRFYDKDHGVNVGLSRFFADTEVGVFLRHSDRGSLAGVQISLPLTFGKDFRPSRVRVRTPSEWSYGLQSVVFNDRNALRSDIARGLLEGLDQTYFDRDRLHPAAVEEVLTQARFWR